MEQRLEKLELTVAETRSRMVERIAEAQTKLIDLCNRLKDQNRRRHRGHSRTVKRCRNSGSTASSTSIVTPHSSPSQTASSSAAASPRSDSLKSQVLSQSQATFPSSQAPSRADSLSSRQSTKPSRGESLSPQTTANKPEESRNQGHRRARSGIELPLFIGEDTYGRSSEPLLLLKGVSGDLRENGENTGKCSYHYYESEERSSVIAGLEAEGNFQPEKMDLCSNNPEGNYYSFVLSMESWLVYDKATHMKVIMKVLSSTEAGELIGSGVLVVDMLTAVHEASEGTVIPWQSHLRATMAFRKVLKEWMCVNKEGLQVGTVEKDGGGMYWNPFHPAQPFSAIGTTNGRLKVMGGNKIGGLMVRELENKHLSSKLKGESNTPTCSAIYGIHYTFMEMNNDNIQPTGRPPDNPEGAENVEADASSLSKPPLLEETVAEAAEDIWNHYGYELGTDNSGIFKALSNINFNIRVAAAEAIVAALDDNPDTIQESLPTLFSLYIRDAGLDEDIIDTDWIGSQGIALASYSVSEVLRTKDLHVVMPFLTSRALADPKVDVRGRMINAGILIIDKPGNKNVFLLFLISENYLNKKASAEERNDLVREGVVIITCALAKHVMKDDPKVLAGVEKLLDVRNTPEAVQRAVSSCLSPLMQLKHEDGPVLNLRLLDKLGCFLLD